MASLSEPFIRRPVGTTLLAIGLCLLGIVAYRFLPVAALPNVDFPMIFVSASRPGAAPSVMAATVAAPLERRLGEIAGARPDHLDQFARPRPGSSCSSRSAATSIAPRATCRPRSTPRSADLPTDLPTLPKFRKANSAAMPVLILALTSKTMPAERDLRRRRHRAGAADLAGAGRRRSHGVGRRPAGGADRAQSGGAVERRDLHRRRPHRRSSTPIRSARSASSTARGRARRCRSTGRCAPRRNSATSSSRAPTAIRCGCRTSPPSRTPPATAGRSPGTTSSRRC